MSYEYEEFVDAEFDRRVRETAYFLWEQAARPWGREKEFWFIALDRSLREREADALLRNSSPKASPAAAEADVSDDDGNDEQGFPNLPFEPDYPEPNDPDAIDTPDDFSPPRTSALPRSRRE